MDDAPTIRRLSDAATVRTQGRLSTMIGIHLIGALQTIRPKWNSSGPVSRLLDMLRLSLLLIATLMLVWKRQWWLLAFFGAWTLYALILPGPVGSWRFRSLADPVFSLGIAAALTPALLSWHPWQRLLRWLAAPKAISLGKSVRAEM